MTVHLGVLAEPGRGLLPLCHRAPLRRPGPPASHCTALIRALAGCRAGRAAGPETWAPYNSKFFSKPKGRLRPAPLPRALAPAWLRRLATSGSAPQGARVCASAPGQRTWGRILGWGWARVAFPGEKALLRVGPGVRHVQTCCWSAAHLILGVAGIGGWKRSDISNQNHLGTESGSGSPRLSGF